jgi:hypothetical protein
MPSSIPKSWLYAHWEELGGVTIGRRKLILKGVLYANLQAEGVLLRQNSGGRREPDAQQGGNKTLSMAEAPGSQDRRGQTTPDCRGNAAAKDSGTTVINTDLLTLCNEYLDDAEVSCLGHDTFAGKQRFCREIIQQWGNIPCTDITIHMVHQYLLKRARRISNNSFNVYRKEGRRLFEWGKKHGLIPRDHINPFAEVERKPHGTGKPRPASIESVTKAYLVANPDQKDLLLTYLVTGARKSEILTWSWDDIDFQNRVYALHTRKTGPGP